MKRFELDQAFPQTPVSFSERFDQTLRQIKEEKPVKKLAVRTMLVAAVITLAIGGIAYAVITLGQEWYYNARFTAYQQYEPDKHQAIMVNMQTEIPQESNGVAAGLVDIKVQDASWAGEKQVFTLSLTASVKDIGKYELHSLSEMDGDGLYAASIDASDLDSRNVHWLWTSKGFGLPKDVMADPGKQLLLIDLEKDLYIGETATVLPGYMTDVFTTNEGPVMAVHEYDLKLADTAEVEKMFQDIKIPEGIDEAQFKLDNQQQKERLMLQAEAAKQAIEDNTDGEGYLSLRLPYSVIPLHNNEFGEAMDGAAHFRVYIGK
ncbi:MAG: hypothetical protein AB9880_05330 [Christensenellales bacterium]